MKPQQRVEELVAAADRYAADVSSAYDEVVEQVIARVADAGNLGKLDLGALTAWKRLRAGTPWMAGLMSRPDREVRQHTERAVAAARIEQCRAELAAGGHVWTARRVDLALYQLGGTRAGNPVE